MRDNEWNDTSKLKIYNLRSDEKLPVGYKFQWLIWRTANYI